MSAVKLDKDSVVDALANQAGKESAAYYVNNQKGGDRRWMHNLALGAVTLAVAVSAMGCGSKTVSTPDRPAQTVTAQAEAAREAVAPVSAAEKVAIAINAVNKFDEGVDIELSVISPASISSDLMRDSNSVNDVRLTADSLKYDLNYVVEKLDEAIVAQRAELASFKDTAIKIEREMVGETSSSSIPVISETQLKELKNNYAKAQEMEQTIQTLSEHRDTFVKEHAAMSEFNSAAYALNHSLHPDVVPTKSAEELAGFAQKAIDGFNRLPSDSPLMQRMSDYLGPEQAESVKNLHDMAHYHNASRPAERMSM